MSLACSLALAATVYKWVDENGVVHYSDQPHANAEKVHVAAPQTYKAGQYDTAPAAAPRRAGGELSGPPTSGCADRPALRRLGVRQPRRAEHPGAHRSAAASRATRSSSCSTARRVNDGAPTGPQFTLTPVERGSHTLQAVVRDAGGELLCQTPGVRFDVHQPSLQNPANPVRPH